MTLRLGSLVLAPSGEKKRPCIVIRLEADGALLVAWGTGTERSAVPPPVLVRLGSRDAKNLRLDKPTYFYAANRVVVSPAAVTLTGRACSPELLELLLKLNGFR